MSKVIESKYPQTQVAWQRYQEAECVFDKLCDNEKFHAAQAMLDVFPALIKNIWLAIAEETSAVNPSLKEDVETGRICHLSPSCRAWIERCFIHC